MKTTLTALALLALVASGAHAQFSLKTFDGKVISNKNKPYSDTPDAQSYFVWEADYVRVQWYVTIGKIKSVDETLVYYVDTDGKTPKMEKVPGDNGKPAVYGAEMKSTRGASFPNYNWRTDAYTQQMSDTMLVLFATEADGKAFFAKLAEKRKTAKAPAKRIVLKKLLKEKK